MAATAHGGVTGDSDGADEARSASNGPGAGTVSAESVGLFNTSRGRQQARGWLQFPATASGRTAAVPARTQEPLPFGGAGRDMPTPCYCYEKREVRSSSSGNLT